MKKINFKDLAKFLTLSVRNGPQVLVFELISPESMITLVFFWRGGIACSHKCQNGKIDPGTISMEPHVTQRRFMDGKYSTI